MSDAMPTPEWAKDASQQIQDAYENVKNATGVKPRDLVPIETFSTHFAEHEVKKDDLLIHIFPRKGRQDRWYPASYTNGKTYVPARREVKVEGCEFPKNIGDLIKKAADNVWQGSVAIEEVPELGAYVVQFQDAKTTVSVVGRERFVDSFCAALDKDLDTK